MVGGYQAVLYKFCFSHLATSKLIEGLISITVSTNLRNPLFKHAYSNILTILQPNNENFHIKNSGSFHTSNLCF